MQVPAHPDDWQAWLLANAVAYLLPHADHDRIAPEVAQRLLDRLAGDTPKGKVPQATLLCWAMALTAGDGNAALLELVDKRLDRLVEQLPTTSEPVQRVWRDGYRGKLDVGRTIAQQSQRGPTVFVTRDRVRNYDRPENVVLRHAVTEIVRGVDHLAAIGVDSAADWARHLWRVRGKCERALYRSALTHVPACTPTADDMKLASHHRDPGFRCAARIAQVLHDAADATGLRQAEFCQALVMPRAESDRFELAVLVRLRQLCADAIATGDYGCWVAQDQLLVSGRRAVVQWRRDDSALLELWFDTTGWCDGNEPLEFQDLQQHYLGRMGLARPDVVLSVTRPSAALPQVLMFEVKASHDEGYLATGLAEALFYACEFSAFAPQSPAAVALGWRSSSGAIRLGDSACYLGWRQLAQSAVVVDFLGAAGLVEPAKGTKVALSARDSWLIDQRGR